MNFIDPNGQGDLVPFPGNPKPPPLMPNPWPCPPEPISDWKPVPGVMDPKKIGKGGAVVALAAANVAIWNCVVAEAYCASQNGLEYGECMAYANPSGYCGIFDFGSPAKPAKSPSSSTSCDTCSKK